MSEYIRGLGFPNNGVLSSAGTNTDLFSVGERTDLAVATFQSLGFVYDKGAATEAIGQQMQALHDHLTAERPTSGIEPFMGIELTNRFGLSALVSGIDAKQKNKTHVYDELWSQYGPVELNRRRIGDQAVAATLQDGVFGQARVMLLDSDAYNNEPGLVYTSRNLNDQVKAIESQELVNPADYLILQAQRREAGLTFLDPMTFTRFPQLDKKSAVGVSWVPDAYSGAGRLWLLGSNGGAGGRVGVRLSVGPNRT